MACLKFVAHLVLAVVCHAFLLGTRHEAVLEAARVELGSGDPVIARFGRRVLLVFAVEARRHRVRPDGSGGGGGALVSGALKLEEALLALLGGRARLLLELSEPARVLRRDELQLLLAIALNRVDLRPAKPSERYFRWPPSTKRTMRNEQRTHLASVSSSSRTDSSRARASASCSARS